MNTFKEGPEIRSRSQRLFVDLKEIDIPENYGFNEYCLPSYGLEKTELHMDTLGPVRSEKPETMPRLLIHGKCVII